MNPIHITWSLNREKNFPFGQATPDPAWFDPIGFPNPWSTRPWIYAVMVASANGVVAWTRQDKRETHPVLAILGVDPAQSEPMSPERIMDKLHMRYLRCFGDCAIGAQTIRDQEELIQTPREENKDDEPELQPLYRSFYKLRTSFGLSHHPRNIIYSPSGRLELGHVVFNTPGLQAVVVTSTRGKELLEKAGAIEKGVNIIAEGESEFDRAALIRAHERLMSELGTRYLDCEGGETVLRALHDAGILDEILVTYTDVTVDESAHAGVLKIFDFESEGAELFAEGRINPHSGWVFRRWRFNRIS